MTINQIEEGLAEFIAFPGPEAAYRLIMNCQGYLRNIAAGWREPCLAWPEKIRELASEMLLILLEDFKPERVVHPRSVLAFVHQRLKKLTRPSRHRETPLGLADSLPETGRTEFTPGRLEFAAEIFSTVRGFLLDYYDEQACQLAFLFIHVFPEVPWASRLLAQSEGLEINRRMEADRKRMALFNQNLRARFRNLKFGEWREVAGWNSGERSHLAWRIISISPGDISAAVENDLNRLDAWRESIDRRQPQSVSDLDAAMRVFNDLRKSRAGEHYPVAAEDAVPWGEPDDLLLQLLGGVPQLYLAKDSVSEWEPQAGLQIKKDEPADPEFIKLAEELSRWFAFIYDEKAANGRKSVGS